MLAKVIAWAPTRERGRRRLAAALEPAEIHGVRHQPRPAGRGAAAPGASWPGDVDTDFLERHDLAALAAPVAEPGRRARWLRSPLRWCWPSGRRDDGAGGIPAGWRNVVSQPQRTAFDVDGDGRGRPSGTADRDGYAVDDLAPSCRRRRRRGRRSRSTGSRTASAVVASPTARVDVDGPLGHVALRACRASPTRPTWSRAGSLLAPMPGTVVSVHVEAGAEVTAGPAGARARGDEDAAHDHRAGTTASVTDLAVGGRARRSPPATCWPSSTSTRKPHDRPDTFTETDERHDAAPAGRRAGRRLRPRRTSPSRRAAAARPPSCGSRSARHGYLGVNIPEEYGGGGGGIGDVAAVCEELAAPGLPAADDGRVARRSAAR